MRQLIAKSASEIGRVNEPLPTSRIHRHLWFQQKWIRKPE